MAAHGRWGRCVLSVAGAAAAALLLASCSGDQEGADVPTASATTPGPTGGAADDPTAAPSVDVEALRSQRPTTGPSVAPVTWESVPAVQGVDASVVDAVQAFVAQETRVLAADGTGASGREWEAFASGRELARRWEDVAKQRVAETTGPSWHRSLARVQQIAPDRWSWRTCADVGQRRAAGGPTPPLPRTERAFDVTYEVVREDLGGDEVYRVEDVRAKGAVPPLGDAAERTCYAWAVHDGSGTG